MSRQVYILVHSTARNRAMHGVAHAPDGYMVTISEPKRKDVQNDKFHAMCSDFAKQATYIGRKWDTESWKRILVDQFAEEMRQAGTPIHQEGEVIPSMDGRRVVQLGIQTRTFYVKEASAFIEYLYAVGAELGVVWSGQQEREVEPCTA